MSPHEIVSGPRDRPVDPPTTDAPRPAPVGGVDPVDPLGPVAQGAPPTPAAPGMTEPTTAAASEQQTEGRHIVRGSSWFIASMITGAALSFVFWALSTKAGYARRPGGVAGVGEQQVVVGVGTKLWVNVQFLNYATSMGLPVAVARYGSLRSRTFNSLFSWALLYTAITSLAGTLLFALAARSLGVDPVVLDTLGQWGAGVGFLLLFLLITGMAFAVLVEVRLVTLRRWRWVYGRALAVSLIRLPLLAVPAIATNPLGLLLLIAGAPALSGLIGVAALRWSTPRPDRGRLRPLLPETLPALRYASVNYPGMLAAQGPQLVLPVIVVIPAAQFAAFFLAWSITVVVFLIPHIIGQVVLSEGSRDTTHIGHQVKVGLKLSLGLMVAATATVVVASPVITRVLGESYRLTGQLLPVLVAASIPWAVTCMCLAKARVERNHLRTVLITTGFAAFTLIPAAVMSARSGPEGAANAWLLGNVAAALLAVAVTRWVKPSERADLLASAAPTTAG